MKSKIKVDRILFPKGCYKTNAGEFSIFTAKVLKHIEGEEPVVHEQYDTITLKGNVPTMGRGDEFIVTYGDGETNDYGTSYKLKTISKEVDKADKKQVYEYLKYVAGSKVADELIQLDNPMELIENRQDDVLLQVKGVGAKVLERIYANASTSLDFSYAYSELLPYGLTEKIISNICRDLGSAQIAVEMCKTNPYALVKVKGISFAKADEIANKCGLDINSNERLQCAIYNILSEGGNAGKTFMSSVQLMSELSKLNLINWAQVNEVVMQMEKEGKLILINNGTEVSLAYYFNLEKEIAQEIIRLRDAKTHIKVREDWMEVVRNIEKSQGWEHTDEQLNGIEMVLNNNVVIVTGYGGTGKSTITNAMTSILKDYEIQQTCLSAKASQRLEECSGLPAKTIHRLLGLGGEEGNFREKSEILTDILIIDEGSMVNGTLFRKILKGLKSGSKLIIAGDTGQLQAIGDCSVLSDLIDSGAIPVVHLTKIHRQAQKSAIITKSIDCRHQKPLYDRDFRGHLVMGELQDLEIFIEDDKENLMPIIARKFKSLLEEGKDINEIQIISPVKTRGATSCDKINFAMQSIYNPKLGESYTLPSGTVLYKGDKVINLKNNYKAKTPYGKIVGIYNGNMGIITNITKTSIIVQFQDVEIEFKNNERNALSLGYCISVHSSQGSQWKEVICVFSSDAYTLLNVEILYTAISRAEKHCTLVAEHSAINIALRNVEGSTKQTYLTKFMSEN